MLQKWLTTTEQRYTATLQKPNPKAMLYTYYSRDTKLISVSTKNIENVERFDKMVVDKIGIICVVVVATIMLAHKQHHNRRICWQVLSGFLEMITHNGDSV